MSPDLTIDNEQEHPVDTPSAELATESSQTALGIPVAATAPVESSASIAAEPNPPSYAASDAPPYASVGSESVAPSYHTNAVALAAVDTQSAPPSDEPDDDGASDVSDGVPFLNVPIIEPVYHHFIGSMPAFTHGEVYEMAWAAAADDDDDDVEVDDSESDFSDDASESGSASFDDSDEGDDWDELERKAAKCGLFDSLSVQGS